MPKDYKPILWCKKPEYVSLLGVWGEIGYSPLMVLRQFGIKQCIPYTYPLRDEGFTYKEASSRPDIQRIVNDWSELIVCPNGMESSISHGVSAIGPNKDIKM